jgi:hypothetical protein
MTSTTASARRMRLVAGLVPGGCVCFFGVAVGTREA